MLTSGGDKDTLPAMRELQFTPGGTEKRVTWSRELDRSMTFDGDETQPTDTCGSQLTFRRQSRFQILADRSNRLKTWAIVNDRSRKDVPVANLSECEKWKRRTNHQPARWPGAAFHAFLPPQLMDHKLPCRMQTT